MAVLKRKNTYSDSYSTVAVPKEIHRQMRRYLAETNDRQMRRAGVGGLVELLWKERSRIPLGE